LRTPVQTQPKLAYPSAPQIQQPAQRSAETARTMAPARAVAQPQRPAEAASRHAAISHESSANGAMERGHAAPSPAEHRVALGAGATLVAQPGHAGFTAIKREPAGGSLVVEQRVDAQGQTHVNAYRQTISADGRTTTRVYADGHRSVDAAGFHSTGRIAGPQFVRYQNGLRAAYAQNGRPLYAETFVHRGTTPMVQRTIYAVNESGHIRELATPQRRYYAVTRLYGYDTFVYQPVFYAAPLYALFYAPLAFPLIVGPQCLVCPDARAMFEVPQSQYSDPIELLGDMQIASAVADQGMAPVEDASDSGAPPAAAADMPPGPDQPSGAPDAAGVPPPPPPPRELLAADTDAADLDTLKQKAGELQAQAAARVRTDSAIAGTPDGQTAAVASAAPLPTDVAPPADNLAVPEDVRTQIHKQVRLSLAQHAHEHPLNLIDIIQSGYSRIYLFQVAGAIDTVSVITGDGCALDSGDLIAFTSLGDSQQRPTAQMKVVAARPGHCLSHDRVEVSVGDLQDMLNTFNQRLEENMRKLHACAATKDGCLRT
jgi:hypothetical protein